MNLPGDRLDQTLGAAVVVGLALLVGLHVLPPSTSDSPTTGARALAMEPLPQAASPAPRSTAPASPDEEEAPPLAAALEGETRAGALSHMGSPERGATERAILAGENPTMLDAPSSESAAVRVETIELAEATVAQLVDELARSPMRWPGPRADFTTRLARQALERVGGRLIAVSAGDVTKRYELVGGFDARAIRIPSDRTGRRLIVPITDAPGSLQRFVRDRWPSDFGRPLIAWEVPQGESSRTTAIVATVVKASGFAPDSIEAVAGEWKVDAGGFAFVPTAVDHRSLGRRPVDIRGGI